MTYIVFDTETTGLDRKYAGLREACSIADIGDEVIQIGGLVLGEDLRPTRAFCFYCDTLFPESNPKALAVHNLPMSSVRDSVSGVFLEEVIAKYLPEFFYDDVTFIGYNVNFDIDMVVQCMRNHVIEFTKGTPVMGKMFERGRHTLDVMAYMPNKAKLSSYHKKLKEHRDWFYRQFGNKLKLETNAPELFSSSWEHAHNSLFDSIETYLLFMFEVWRKRVFGGGVKLG